ncbi:MAG: hypothetical protein ACI9YE_002801 [Psychroserpens sp.]|jgi:hypothetical protein
MTPQQLQTIQLSEKLSALEASNTIYLDLSALYDRPLHVHTKLVEHLPDNLINFINLEHLVLTGFYSLRSLSVLFSLTKLKTLELSLCDALGNEIDIQWLKKIAVLSLKVCCYYPEKPITHFEQLTQIGKLTNLTKLTIYDLTQLVSLSGIEKLTNLTELSIRSCYGLVCIDAITTLPNLTKLELLDCDSLSKLDGLILLQKISYLWLCLPRYSGSYKEITQLINLETLEIDGKVCKQLTSLNDFYKLKKLQRLSLLGGSKLLSLNGIENLLMLTELTINGCHQLKNIEALSSLDKLAELAIYDCPQLKDIKVLNSLNKLTELNIIECNAIDNIDFAQWQVPECLKKLTLYHSGNLHLFNIVKLINLTTLILIGKSRENKTTWCSIEDIGELLSVQELLLARSITIHSLKPLKKLSKLTTLNLADRQIVLVADTKKLQLQYLEYIHLTGCEQLENINVQNLLPKLIKVPIDHEGH